jgi:hypothetical protein
MGTVKAFVRGAFGLSLLLLAGCATHTWAPGPDAKGTFEEAKAQCQLMARHSGGSYYASGTPSFVAGATAGAAIGEAIRTQADFNDCMSASGWTVADDKAGSSAARAASVQTMKTAGEQLKTCIETFRNDPKYTLIEPHVLPYGTTHFTLVQLSDENVPTADEAANLAAYEDATDVCRDQFVTQLAMLDARASLTYKRIQADTRAVKILLIEHKISWGEGAQRVQSILDTAMANIATGRS